MKELWSYLQSANRPIVLYGMGDGGDKILKVLNRYGIGVSGVFASDDFVRGQSFHGMKVQTYADAQKAFGRMIVLLAFGTARKEVLTRILQIAGEQELYVPDVPVIGDTLFDLSFAKAHADDLAWVYQRLFDKQSRLVFSKVVDYKLSGDFNLLLQCETPPEEANETILKLIANERYLDLGAYTGDTVSWFLQRTGGRYGTIWAVEPDRRSFRRLEAAYGGKPNITCLNVGIGDTVASLPFTGKGGRNSRLAKDGEARPFSTVDTILHGEKATYLKMDVEGQEQAAIRGAKETILAHRPKLLISCYHRSEDLFAIPREIWRIRDDYRLFMRHYPCLPAWDVNYYFV